MKKFSFVGLVQFLLVSLFVGSIDSSSAESTQHLPSVTVASKDISSAHNTSTASGSIIRRVLKKAKGSEKEPKASKSGKQPKASKSGKKVSKSSKTVATASPSQLSDELADQQSSQEPSSPPTVDPCASIITQKDALLALKDGFENGDTVLIDWGSDTDPCDENTSNWSYITCVSDKVTVISLYEDEGGLGLGLEGTISPLIGCPTTLVSSLTSLSFWENSLTGIIPTQLGALTSLEYLDFDTNSLTGIIPTELGALKSLGALYFTHNRLEGSIPTELGKLSSLEFLGFYNNTLDGSIPTELGNLIILIGLNFSHNNLEGSIPTQLGALTSLFGLGFDNNDLTGTMPSDICALRNGNLIGLFADCAGTPPEVDCAFPSCCSYCYS